jgi:hypothetical protein
MDKNTYPQIAINLSFFASLRDELTMPERVSAVLLKRKTNSQIPSVDLRR